VSARTERLPLPPRYAALAIACGGDPEVRRRGTQGAIQEIRGHDSAVIVCVTTARTAGVPAAVMAALVERAPVIATRNRQDAAEAREKAAALLARADTADRKAAAIEAAAAALRGAT